MNPFGDPRKLMKQVQEMQGRMQEEVAALRVEASTGGGMVKVVMTGEKNLENPGPSPRPAQPACSCRSS